jgi:hypothetical protein
MSLTVNQIIAVIAPQYVNDPDLADITILAIQRTSEPAFGVNYNFAISLRAAHMLTLRDMNKNGVNSGLGGATGTITSKREGNTSISFGSLSGITGTTGSRTGDLGLTRYGIELLGLIAGNIVGFSVTNYTDASNNIIE